MMKLGLIIGRFDPPHQGHSVVLDVALGHVERLLVFVRQCEGESVPAALRIKWLQEIYPQVDFMLVVDDPAIKPDDLEAQARRAHGYLGELVPDVLFSSEAYDPIIARMLGAKSYSVDRDCHWVPINSTMVRRNPLDYLQYLAPVVRAHYVKRVCVVGSESTGKTTLCKKLAATFDTNWVSEYGRDYSLVKRSRGDLGRWTTDEFFHIGREQRRWEDEAARRANKVLFCDTDEFATEIWLELYMSKKPESWPLPPSKIDLYLLPYPDVPFVSDGIRDAEHRRFWMFERFQEELTKRGRPFIILEGEFEEREAQAGTAVERLLASAGAAAPNDQDAR
jgi:HTH-type transcriptional regulator, transcriptional repressor of NAD biosynthesis genes